jgi:hypothetical protein
MQGEGSTQRHCDIEKILRLKSIAISVKTPGILEKGSSRCETCIYICCATI